MIHVNESNRIQFPKVSTVRTITPLQSQTDPVRRPTDPTQPFHEHHRISPLTLQPKPWSGEQQFLKIQNAVPLTNQNHFSSNVRLTKRHINEDPVSSCCCAFCCEIRSGDLLSKSQITLLNGQINYQCVICGGRFVQKSLLLRHCRFARHCYFCELCGAGFTLWNYNLYQMHSKLHSDKPHSAAQCYTSNAISTALPSSTDSQTVNSIPTATNHNCPRYADDMFQATTSSHTNSNNNNNEVRARFGFSAYQDISNCNVVHPVTKKLHRRDDEVVFISEKSHHTLPIMHQQLEKQVSATVSKNKNFSRVLHNSELTLTPIGLHDISKSKRSTNSSARMVNNVTQNQPPVNVMKIQPEFKEPKTTAKLHPVHQTQRNDARGSSLPQSKVCRMVVGNQPFCYSSDHVRTSLATENGYTNASTTQPLNVTSTISDSVINTSVTSMTAPPPPPPLISSALQLVSTSQASTPFNTFPEFHSGPPKLIPIAQQANSNPTNPSIVTSVRCHVCNLVFHSLVNFQLHFDAVHKCQFMDKVFKCGRCLKVYANYSQLRRHEANCVDKVLCRKCSHLFYHRDLWTHYKQTHMQENVSQELTPAKLFISSHLNSSHIIADDRSEGIGNFTGIKNDFVEIIPMDDETTHVLPQPAPSVVEDQADAVSSRITHNSAVAARENVSKTKVQPVEKNVEVVSEAMMHSDQSMIETQTMSVGYATESQASSEVLTTESTVPVALQVDICTSHINVDLEKGTERNRENKMLDKMTLEMGWIEENVERTVSKNVFSCVVCDCTFDDADAFQVHVKMHHDVSSSKTDDKYVCTFCQRTFGKRRQLSNHLRTHFLSCRTTTKSLRLPKNSNNFSLKLAVAVFDINNMTTSANILRRLGVIGFLSLKELKSHLLSGQNTI